MLYDLLFLVYETENKQILNIVPHGGKSCTLACTVVDHTTLTVREQREMNAVFSLLPPFTQSRSSAQEMVLVNSSEEMIL